MKPPRDNDKLDGIFKNARVPGLFELEGEYFVDMLTTLPSLRMLSHRKVFYKGDNKVLGYNVVFANKRWGHFFVEEGVCEELGLIRVAVINYDRKENSFVSNKIRDYLRCVETDKLYLGRFNYLFRGEPRFLGYFSLIKKEGSV